MWGTSSSCSHLFRSGPSQQWLFSFPALACTWYRCQNVLLFFHIASGISILIVLMLYICIPNITSRYKICSLQDTWKVIHTVYCWCWGGRLQSALLLGLGCDWRKRLQDRLLVSLFKVLGFVWGQRRKGGGAFSSTSLSSDSHSHSCNPSALATFTEQRRSEIVCLAKSPVLFKGERVCQNTSSHTCMPRCSKPRT